MSKEEIFNAARDSFGLLGGFFKDVAQEIGKERALALYAKQGETLGNMLAETMQEKLGDRELDIATVATVMSDAVNTFGMTCKFEQSPNSVKWETPRCPIYDGFKEAGLDHNTIESACKLMAPVDEAALRKSFPQISFSLKFRSAPDQSCVEEISIGK